MKARMVMTPLAFALATAMAATAVQAESQNNQQFFQSGAEATVDDSQSIQENKVINEGTVNDASATNIGQAASGNIGINIVAGTNNQQANAAALATADAQFVFGSASASTTVGQTLQGNVVKNYANPSTATLTNALNNASGNVAANVAAGTYNQQKNDLAAAVSAGRFSTATSSATQDISGETTNNKATLEYAAANVSLSLSGVGGTYSGSSDQEGDVYLDTWNGEFHPAGPNTGHVDVDSAAQGATDSNNDGGAFHFNEQGDISLSGNVTGQLPVVAGFQAPVTNTATLTNSLNGVSGNVGVNIAAGSGNQQSNSLAIAAGCTSCPAGGTSPGSESGLRL
ncbi:hypothetical protein NVV93_09175 [Pseudomonas sp. LS44]|uniref:hypothetical protein n=1 Tax=Pseudomonas sp. LS44 TaxID=1357074 RepID=UPI00215A5A6D|nr:hypothetical protein [Pseudomonas sp. LS44]UVE19520.1 hypothetical protein NVV93_09175 [Pseudomonas sp. LS44]